MSLHDDVRDIITNKHSEGLYFAALDLMGICEAVEATDNKAYRDAKDLTKQIEKERTALHKLITEVG